VGQPANVAGRASSHNVGCSTYSSEHDGLDPFWLKISRDRLAAVSFHLWQGRTFSEERDRLAGPGASPQKRGRVSRALQAELEKEMADGNR
jgi:hypothetical protein